jgi:hypothetical protein
MQKQINFDYSTEIENQLLKEIETSIFIDEQTDAYIRQNKLDDRIRSLNVAKQYKRYLKDIGQL